MPHKSEYKRATKKEGAKHAAEEKKQKQREGDGKFTHTRTTRTGSMRRAQRGY